MSQPNDGTTYHKADERGVPSLVWRAGQNRRLGMIVSAGELVETENGGADGPLILVDGCGVGMYNQALQAYSSQVYGIDVEAERVLEASHRVPNVAISVGENLPYSDNKFALVLSHEVIEHVSDDRRYAAEMVRVLRPGGRAVIFCPNRLYPFETHGHYWRGEYHFGNTPLINYLPNPLRNKLAPHVRAYTSAGLRGLFAELPVRVVNHRQIYPGYDNLVRRHKKLGQTLKAITYRLEKTPLRAFGLSHLLVVEKVG